MSRANIKTGSNTRGGDGVSDYVKKAIFGFAELGKDEDEIGVKAIDQYEELKATATHLRELLRECNSIMPACPKCKGNLKTWENLSENKTIRVGHADDCELAKELADD